MCPEASVYSHVSRECLDIGQDSVLGLIPTQDIGSALCSEIHQGPRAFLVVALSTMGAGANHLMTVPWACGLPVLPSGDSDHPRSCPGTFV